MGRLQGDAPLRASLERILHILATPDAAQGACPESGGASAEELDETCPQLLVASLLLVAMPGAPSGF